MPCYIPACAWLIDQVSNVLGRSVYFGLLTMLHTHTDVCVCVCGCVGGYYLLDAADLVESGPLTLVLEH